MIKDIFEMPIHPSANVFPMLDDDEMANLVENIKANGLLHPLVIKDNQLIDGRNRREACKRAGIQPEVVELKEVEPEAYIIAANIERRHLTKSQRAMAVAMIYPEPDKAWRGRKSEVTGKLLENKSFTAGLLSQARTVLKWLPEAADGILNGAGIPLAEAYKEACGRAEASKAPTARLEELRVSDPDLADLVKNEKLSLEDAEAAADNRKKAAIAKRREIFRPIRDLKQFVLMISSINWTIIEQEAIAHPDEQSWDDVVTLRQQLLQLLSFEEDGND